MYVILVLIFKADFHTFTQHIYSLIPHLLNPPFFLVAVP